MKQKKFNYWKISGPRCLGDNPECCSFDVPCILDEGPCSGDEDCASDLVCGKCGAHNPHFGEEDNCCVFKCENIQVSDIPELFRLRVILYSRLISGFGRAGEAGHSLQVNRCCLYQTRKPRRPKICIAHSRAMNGTDKTE